MRPFALGIGRFGASGLESRCRPKLGELDHTAGLRKIGYTRCWYDESFVQNAMERAEFRVIVDECATADMGANDMCIDDEEERMLLHPTGPSIDE